MTARALLAIAAAALLAPAALADLPRLPADLTLRRGGDSPGVVTFRHESHVDAARPACVGCHPARFSILGRSAGAPKSRLDHAAMERGQGCGACHGKAAFGFEDCGNCHAQ